MNSAVLPKLPQAQVGDYVSETDPAVRLEAGTVLGRQHWTHHGPQQASCRTAADGVSTTLR